jgi:serine/threonine protein kinase
MAALCKAPGAVLLGQGGYGQVWKVFSPAHGKEVARKYYKEKRHADTEAFWYGLIQSMGGCEQHIVKMLGRNEDGLYSVIELEFADGGTLYEVAFRKDARGYYVGFMCASLTTPALLKELVRGCLGGLCFLHDRVGIVHSDIKPDNILMHRGKPKLADLGLCSEISNNARPRIGTFGYVAPEVFLLPTVAENGGKTDVFSLGVTFFECFEGMAPTPLTNEFWRAFRHWNECTNEGRRLVLEAELKNVAKAFYDPSNFSARLMDGTNTLPGVLDQAVTYLVAEMLRVNERKRPAASDCLKILDKLSEVAKESVGCSARQHSLPRLAEAEYDKTDDSPPIVISSDTRSRSPQPARENNVDELFF